MKNTKEINDINDKIRQSKSKREKLCQREEELERQALALQKEEELEHFQQICKTRGWNWENDVRKLLKHSTFQLTSSHQYMINIQDGIPLNDIDSAKKRVDNIFYREYLQSPHIILNVLNNFLKTL